jgi:flagellar protein FlaG
LARPLGTAIEQVAAVATPSPLAIAFPAGTAANSGALQARSPGAGPVQANAAQTRVMNASGAAGPAASPAIGTPPAALQTVIDTVNTQLLTAGKSLQLSVDTLSGHSIVVVRDTQTGGIVQQFPSEELLRLASLLGTDPHLLIDLTV